MAGRKNPYLYDPEYYVHGSTVKKIKADETASYAVEPVRKKPARLSTPDRKKPVYPQPQRKSRPYEQPQPEEGRLVRLRKGVSFLGMIVLTAAILATVGCCISYLKLRADFSLLDKEIAALENKLEDLVTANTAKEEELLSSIDLDQIYQKAVGEFGMVFPNHNEVVYYDSVDTSYVRQYADIPEAAASILDKLVP